MRPYIVINKYRSTQQNILVTRIYNSKEKVYYNKESPTYKHTINFLQKTRSIESTHN